MNIDILKLIPQREPIVMVDTFYGMEGNTSLTGLTVTKDNLFCIEGVLDECGIIEHIAQSAATRVGYICRIENNPFPVGYIGSVDKMTIHRLPEAAETLQTRIEIVQEVGDITLVAATVTVKNELIAKGQLKIFLKRDI